MRRNSGPSRRTPDQRIPATNRVDCYRVSHHWGVTLLIPLCAAGFLWVRRPYLVLFAICFVRLRNNRLFRELHDPLSDFRPAINAPGFTLMFPHGFLRTCSQGWRTACVRAIRRLNSHSKPSHRLSSVAERLRPLIDFEGNAISRLSSRCFFERE